MQYLLSKHAQDVIEEREIQPEWVERVLTGPQLLEEDPLDEELEHRLGKIEEYGNRVLRVVLNKQTKPVKVVTAYFDRKMKGKL